MANVPPLQPPVPLLVLFLLPQAIVVVPPLPATPMVTQVLLQLARFVLGVLKSMLLLKLCLAIILSTTFVLPVLVVATSSLPNVMVQEPATQVIPQIINSKILLPQPATFSTYLVTNPPQPVLLAPPAKTTPSVMASLPLALLSPISSMASLIVITSYSIHYTKLYDN